MDQRGEARKDEELHAKFLVKEENPSKKKSMWELVFKEWQGAQTRKERSLTTPEKEVRDF